MVVVVVVSAAVMVVVLMAVEWHKQGVGSLE